MSKRALIITALAVIAAAIFTFAPLGTMHQALACNWGSPGGGDFGPQERYKPAPAPSGEGVTQNQAYDILSGHLARLNPNLEVGKGRDAGTHYEFEVLINGKGVDRLAVDKSSGLIRPVN